METTPSCALQHRLIITVAAVITSPSVWPDVEEARLTIARELIPTTVERYASIVDELVRNLATTTDPSSIEPLAADAARMLWQRSVADVQTGFADDRPLYWGRLALREAIRNNVAPQSLARPLLMVERRSRGMADIEFPDASELRVLITGFDPFHLDQNIAQSNPSGLAALSLDGVALRTGDRIAHVQAALIPVRFEDFDKGLIEDFFADHYGNDTLSLVVTLSMGRDEFDLERFPGRRRSAESLDNRNVPAGGSAENPLIPMSGDTELRGPEFVEFSLPAVAMVTAKGKWKIRDNRAVQTLETGSFEASSLADLSGSTAVLGSGGGYLSNEISYRSIVLRNNLGHTFPIGHLHTPSVAGYVEETERSIIEQIRRMLEHAIGAL